MTLKNGVGYIFLGWLGLFALLTSSVEGAVPSAPTGLTATGSYSQATVTWNAVTGATSYNLYYATFSGVTPANGTAMSGLTSVGPFGLGGLTNGISYYFIVTAVNASGESAASSQTSTLIGGLPFAPWPLARPGNGQVTLVWAPYQTVTSYNVYYSASPDVSPTNGTKLSTSNTTLTIPSLTNGVPYYFIMSSVNSYGEGSANAPVVSATPGQAVPTPSGVSASPGPSYGFITMTWAAVSGATSYNVYLSSVTGVTGPNNGQTLYSATNSFSFYGFSGVSNYMVVTAVSAAGESAPSAQVTAIPMGTTPPSTPTGISAAAGVNQVTLNWSAVSGASYYFVYYSTFSGVTQANGTGFYSTSNNVVLNLAAGKTYYFIVTAGNGNGESAPSVQVSATPTLPSTAPSAPTGLTATGLFSQVNLAWNKSATATSYNLYYATFTGVTKANGIAVVGMPDLSAGIGGLTNGINYYFIVTAVNQIGESAPSSQASALVGGLPYPPNPVARPGNGQVTLAWQAISAVASYNIYYSVNSNVAPGNGTKLSTTGSSVLIPSLSNGTQYYFVVTSVSSFGEGSPSYPITATPGSTPPTPTGVSAVSGPGNYNVTVSWTPVPNVLNYYIYYSTASGVTPSNGSPYFSSITNPTFSVPYLATYYFVVTAVTSSGESAPSAQISAVPLLPQPPAPTQLTAARGDSQVTLNWASQGFATGWNIYYRTSPGVTPANGTKVSVTQIPYTVPGLTNGTPYYFVVTAFNISSESAPSTEVSATPLGSSPYPGSIVKTGSTADEFNGFGPAQSNTRSLARGADGKFHVVYARGTPLNIYYAFSTDNGQSWTEEPVTSQTGTNDQSPHVALAVDSVNNVHVIWSGQGWGANTTYFNIQYRKRTNTGWQLQESLTDKPTIQYDVAIAVDSTDNVHVVWDGFGWGANPSTDNIEYRKRTSTGWQPIVEAVIDINAPDVYPTAALAIDSADNVHVAWSGAGANTQNSFYNILYRKRTTTGWQTQEQVTNINDYQDVVSIAIDSTNNVHLSWDGLSIPGASTSTYNIFYAKRTTTWQPIQAVTNQTTGDTYEPSIALDASDNVHVAWTGYGVAGETFPNVYNLRYAQRLSTGWQPAVALTNRADNQFNPTLIWALNPTAAGVHPNRPKTGYALVWDAENGSNPPQIRHLASSNLTWDSAASSPCDLNNDGAVNILDIQSEVSVAFGTVSCTAPYDINKDSFCNILDVQRLVNAAFGGACVSP